MKTLHIIAGANGSGKTTFALNFAKLENLKFINGDNSFEIVEDDNQLYNEDLKNLFLESI